MYVAYFYDCFKEKHEVIGSFATEDVAFKGIVDYLTNQLKVHPYYYRMWGECDSERGKMIDYGSHTKFCRIKKEDKNEKV